MVPQAAVVDQLLLLKRDGRRKGRERERKQRERRRERERARRATERETKKERERNKNLPLDFKLQVFPLMIALVMYTHAKINIGVVGNHVCDNTGHDATKECTTVPSAPVTTSGKLLWVGEARRTRGIEGLGKKKSKPSLSVGRIETFQRSKL